MHILHRRGRSRADATMTLCHNDKAAYQPLSVLLQHLRHHSNAVGHATILE